MICLHHCLLSPLVASLISPCIECQLAMLIDCGDLDILFVKHACLLEPTIFGCSCIICLHTMKCSLVLSYDEHDAYTCWVSYHTNDRFCTSANLICFSECLSCSFILKDSQGGAIMRQLGHAKAHMMCNTIICENILKVNYFLLSHPQICIL